MINTKLLYLSVQDCSAVEHNFHTRLMWAWDTQRSRTPNGARRNGPVRSGVRQTLVRIPNSRHTSVARAVDLVGRRAALAPSRGPHHIAEAYALDQTQHCSVPLSLTRLQPPAPSLTSRMSTPIMHRSPYGCGAVRGEQRGKPPWRAPLPPHSTLIIAGPIHPHVSLLASNLSRSLLANGRRTHHLTS